MFSGGLLAVDPGLSGAVCAYWPKIGRMDVLAMPVTAVATPGKKSKRKVLVEHELFDMVRGFAAEGVAHLFIEKVGGMPGQSAPAAFNFGRGYGAVVMAAIACGLTIEHVPAATWKGALRVPADKNAARLRASEMIPTHRHLWTRAGQDGLAEAALLALYGLRRLNGETFTPERNGRDVQNIRRGRADREQFFEYCEQRKAQRQAAQKARREAVATADDPDLAKSLF